MNDMKAMIEQADDAFLKKYLIDGFHRIIFHYGNWFAETEHQFGSTDALKIEKKVWETSFGIQMKRLGKILDFTMNDGIPDFLDNLPRETLMELLEAMGTNWLANDGVWFQGVENNKDMGDAKRVNDTCWLRYSPFEAMRIKALMELPENGGLESLKTALGYRMYALINEQTVEMPDDNTLIFKMVNCRVQAARKRKGLADYPCKSAGLVEYTTFAKAVDSRIKTECIACPPDAHPDDFFCAWKFTL